MQRVVEPRVYVLEETLRGRFQQEDLGVVVLVVRQVTTLLTHQLLMQHAVCYVVLVVVGAGVWGFLLLQRTLGFEAHLIHLLLHLLDLTVSRRRDLHLLHLGLLLLILNIIIDYWCALKEIIADWCRPCLL